MGRIITYRDDCIFITFANPLLRNIIVFVDSAAQRGVIYLSRSS